MKCSLIAFVSLYASAALMIAELRGAHGKVETINKPQCETPQEPFCNISDNWCDKADFVFIFNSTSGLCEEELIEPSYHNNTFQSRFECVSTCNPSQGAPFCAESPRNACNGSTEDSKVAYFYNVSARECQEYEDCGEDEHKTMDWNGFYGHHNCEFHCKGFNESNVCGSEKTEQFE